MGLGKLKSKVVVSTVTALALTSPAKANDEDYRELSNGWTVSSDENTCGIINEYDTPNGTIMLIIIKNINDESSISIKNNNWSIVKGRFYNIKYSLNGGYYSGESKGVDGGFAIKIHESFEADFAAAKSLYMTIDEKVIAHISMVGSANALKHLNGCVAKLKRAHAAEQREKAKYAYIDPDPFATTAPLPIPIATAPKPSGSAPRPVSQNWTTLADYPSAALAMQLEGKTKFLVKVNAVGRVETCEIIASSGHVELDTATCAIVTRRAKFIPATNDQGNPVEGFFEGVVAWELPQ